MRTQPERPKIRRKSLRLQEVVPTRRTIPRDRPKSQTIKLTLLMSNGGGFGLGFNFGLADGGDHLLAGASPRSDSSAVSGPSAHRGNGRGASLRETPECSSTAASDPASPASGSDAAIGASATRCSCTPPHCWHAPLDLTPPPPAGRTRASSGRSSGREPAAPTSRVAITPNGGRVRFPGPLPAQPPQVHESGTQLFGHGKLAELAVELIQKRERLLRLEKTTDLGPLGARQPRQGQRDLPLRPRPIVQ